MSKAEQKQRAIDKRIARFPLLEYDSTRDVDRRIIMDPRPRTPKNLTPRKAASTTPKNSAK